MKSTFILITFLVYLTGSAAAQQPDWVDNNGISPQYPASLYVTGFGIGEDESPAERLSLAEQNARSDLSAKFLVKIRSELFSSEHESTTGGYKADFHNTVSSQTQLSMIDVDIVNFDDGRHKRSYALATMKIGSGIQNYGNRVAGLTKEISALIKAAELAQKNGNAEAAITSYRKTFPLFIELGEARTILSILLGRSPVEMQDAAGTVLLFSSAEVESRINSILHEDIMSLDAAVLSLADQLRFKGHEKISLTVYPLTYLDTDFPSAFSAAFLPMLETKLTPYFEIVTRDMAAGVKSPSGNILTGSYWVNDEKVRIIMYITDMKTGSKLAAATVNFPAAVVEKEGIELQPRNFQQAMEDSKVFLKQDVIPGTLSLEVWTSKGDRNLIFQEKEETHIFVRVNKPCYLQVLYHMANGVRLLLYNNYYIDISKVNQVVTLPDTFYFVPPLGVERLQVFANTEKFDDVRTIIKEYDGITYDTVFAEDFREYTITMRGIMRVNQKREITEKIITITTIQ